MEPALAETASEPEAAHKIAAYEPLESRRDEAMGGDGSLRSAWAEVFESAGRHGNEEVVGWRKEAARISRERGLAYRPDRIDAADRSAQWSLGPIPWVFSSSDWKTIKVGVSQRVRLFEAILADLYGGKQRIFSEKLVPPEIILDHPGYIRALHNFAPDPGRIGIGMAATDLGRGNSGQLFALNDRFDHPFDLGLALENRTIVNTILPRLFRRNRVRRIGHFFVEWFNYLSSCAPSQSETARVAILDETPEDRDSEISFLANYCGILRVVPSDLTVRSGRVWLKTLGGLEQIDVIWKYTAGRELDPLETSRGFGRGITGIFESMRQGNVVVASHPGCEVLQSPGLFPYLAKICRTLLGEQLQIPPVATWWCGDPGPKSHVLGNLANMVVKSTGLHRDFQTLYGSRLSASELYDLKARIEANPDRFVAQEELVLSTVPVSTDEGLKPRGAVLRTFSFMGPNQTPVTMPGGLARVSAEDGLVVSTRQTGESKDVWVRAEPTEPFFNVVNIAGEVRRSRLTSPETVTSNAGENLYWAGRNAEQIDFISRFATRILEGRVFGFAHESSDEEEHEATLIRALFALGNCSNQLDSAQTLNQQLLMILKDSDSPVSIGGNLQHFRRTTNATREQWSPTSVLAIESICKGWAESTRNLQGVFGYQSPLESLQLNLAAFLGMNLDSMTRDHGWIMLDAGRRIERALNTVDLLAYILAEENPESIETLLAESVLFISDSLGTYQSLNFTEPKSGPMLRLLLGETDYPRSVRFLLDRLEHHFGKLPKPSEEIQPIDFIQPARQQLGAFLGKLSRENGDVEP
ncbi:MAG: circularly permuted type 2 ATP-grasp protein, partial [Verrucomicrobiota bacterium]